MISRLLADSLVYGFSRTASQLIGILIVPIYTRVFSSDDYGLLSLLTTGLTILTLVSGMQVESGVAREYYDAKRLGHQKEVVGTGLILSMAGVTVWALVAAISFQLWWHDFNQIDWSHFAPILFALLPTQVLGYWLVLLRLERRRQWFTSLAAGDVMTSAAFGLIAVLALGWGVPGVLWGLGVSKAMWAIVGLKPLASAFQPILRPKQAFTILAYGLPLMPSAAANWAQSYANRFALAATLSLAEVGVFSLSLQIASVLAIAITSVRQAWDPYALEIMGQAGSHEKYARMLDMYLFAVFSLAALIGALGFPIANLLAPETYRPAGRLVGFMAVGLFWIGAVPLVSVGLYAVRRTYWLSLGLAIGAVANITLLLIMVDLAGLLAAGISYILGAMTSVAIILLVAQHYRRIPFRYRTLAGIAVLSLIVSLAMYLLPPPTDSGFQLALATVPRLMVVAFSITLAYLILDPGDRARLTTYLRAYLRVTRHAK